MCVWLREQLSKAVVPESHLVGRETWKSERAGITAALLESCHPPLIVRSSAPDEDQAQSSQAGRYLSVGSVKSGAQLEEAIDAVFGSYDRETPDDIIFVQEMLTEADCVGVAFNADPESGSPYLIVNYAESSQTDMITSGRASYATWVSHGPGTGSPPLPALKQIPAVLAEIQDICDYRALDIEFGVRDNRVYVFQVRELTTVSPQPSGDSICIATRYAIESIRAYQTRNPRLLGRTTLFGVMPDWNPAEIVGIKPRPLALSMYRTLVTDRHWSTRRSAFGYRTVSDIPLIQEFLGTPYVDVRASFNSLIPAVLSDKIAGDFVDAALQRLAEKRELHDKVEFAVLPTCYTADLRENLTDRFGALLPRSDIREISEALRGLTRRLLDNAELHDREERTLLSQLKLRRGKIGQGSILARLRALISDAEKFGIVAFVGQARRAFIAMDILRSLLQTRAMTKDRFSELLASVDTVAGRFQRDKLWMSKRELLLAYGHLRPGTYDINAPRYDQLSDSHFVALMISRASALTIFSLQPQESKAIDAFLARLGTALSAEEFIQFVTKSIASREETKFEFTKNISDALELLALWCQTHGFTRDDASFLRLNDVLDAEPDRAEICDIIAVRRADYQATYAAKVPMLVVAPEELWSFSYSEDQPNYIGASTITGPPATWPTDDALDGAILLIESADPGFEWIFGTNIAGFITMFGGPNSHMAIRAHELGMTAIIGAGPALYENWRRASVLRIDSSEQRVEIIP